MKKFFVSIGYYIVFAFFWCIASLPFFIIFRLSELLYFLLYYIVGYRKKVVRKNLINSFPEKSKKELIRLEKKFYLSFCDNFFETIKPLAVAKKSLDKRYIIKNRELLDQFYKENTSVIIYSGHYGNWEWIGMLQNLYDVEKTNYSLEVLYSPLENEISDRIFYKIRSKHTKGLIPKQKVLRTILEREKANLKSMYVFIADQNPLARSIHTWMKFLNQETAILGGAERIAKQYQLPVVYMDITRTKRSSYEVEFVLITDNAANMPGPSLSLKYMELLEKNILRDPALWLWTHRRWKHKRNEKDPIESSSSYIKL